MNKTDKAETWALIQWTHGDYTSLQNVLIDGSPNPDNYSTIAEPQIGQCVPMDGRPEVSGIVLAITNSQNDIYKYARR